MVRSIAPLVYYDRVDGTYIKMGTGSWLHWLSQNRTFRYESFWGSFIACKEHRGEEIVWIAYRRVKEQQRCADLGASEDLTLAHLIDMAKKLSANNTTPWNGQRQTNNIFETYSHQPETISKEIETNSVSQWCIFYTHPTGQVEFLGACGEKEQALNQLKNILNSANSSESIGSLPSQTSDRYEVREELVIPVGYAGKRFETNSFATQATTKEIELLNQVSQLRHQLAKLQRQLEQERRLNSNNDASIKFIWN